MGKRYQRLGIRVGRGWIALLALVAVVAAVAFWVGPLRPWPAEFQLVLEDGGAPINESDPPVYDAPVRTVGDVQQFALPLAVRNIGGDAGAPVRLRLSVPPHFHVVARRLPVQAEITSGVPLRRYTIALPARTVPADSAVRPLPGIDTIWLQPALTRYTCVLRTGMIPEFQPAPALPAEALAALRIFYTVQGQEPEARGSGLLTVRTDPVALRSNPAPMPPAFPTTFPEEEERVPDLGQLRGVGTRRALCGDAESPAELYTVTWRNAAGARVYSIYIDAVERKRLYDLEGDDVIDFETWDSDADGSFEARRQARYEVPGFLKPFPPRDPRLLRPDSLPPDSGFVRAFAAVDRGPGRFAEYQRLDSARAVSDSLRAVGDSVRRRADSAVLASDDEVPPPDSAFVALFAASDAGPFRFGRRARQAADSARAAAAAAATRRNAEGGFADTTASGGAAISDTTRDGGSPPDSTGAGARLDSVPARPTRRPPRPIGTPVPPP